VAELTRIFLFHQTSNVDIHELRADDKARSWRGLNSPFGQDESGWFYADPLAGSFAPEVLDELLHTTPV
jgi:hypothetical protein